MRILWVSNHPEAGTGYGTQTRQAVPRIQAMGHTVDLVAFYGQEGYIGSWSHPSFPDQVHTVYPKMFHGYGADAAAYWAEQGEYDVIISLIDAWVMPGAQLSATAHWAPWFPVDSDPMPDRVLQQAQFAQTPIVFSRHAEAAGRQRGLAPRYVPHAIDPKVYRPVNRDFAREYLGLPKDAFVFGYVMANKGNPPRKAWDRHFEALGEMMRQHSDVCAFIHSLVTPEMQGVPLMEWMQAYGIPPERVRFADRLKFVSGMYGEEDVNLVYNGIDALVNVSNGEGFGIPIMEAQFAGTPVIAGAWTAMDELVHSGWKVPRERAEKVRLAVGAWQYEGHASAIRDCMEAAYRDDSSRTPEEIRSRVLDYSADIVADTYWRPVLEEIQARLTATPEPVEVIRG
jgi:glycosyltransferase involved in cell wall biosynthesis